MTDTRQADTTGIEFPATGDYNGAMNNTRIVSGQESWEIQSDTVRLAVSRLGGMMAPVRFFVDSGSPVEPYYISPWAEEGLEIDVPVLAPLRGDFFCMPFGANAGTNGRYTVHGEPASGPWTLVGQEEAHGSARLRLEMQLRNPGSRITKDIRVRSGESVVYVTHRIEGADGRFPLGHHATLAPPPAGRFKISTSPVAFGLTTPRPAGPMVADEYFALPPLTEFSGLESVPTIWTSPETLDCSIFPGVPGFSDILSLHADRSRDHAWTAAVAEQAGFLWFSVKDPRVLPSTVIWVENGGRRGSPWLGRNQCIGLEEVCGYLAEGLPAAAEDNPLNARGVPTVAALQPDVPLEVNYLQGVLRVQPGFGAVTDVSVSDHQIQLVGSGGITVSAPAAGRFVRSGPAAL